jgi:hypothetical protein
MTQEALKLAIQLRDTASGYWTENEISIIAKLIEALAQPEQEPVAIKRMKEWIEYLKRKSDFGQHMKIPSEMSAGACWELAIELEQFINTTPPQRKPLTDDLYNELLFAVGNKCPNETRHQTALRYILQAEKGDEKAAHGIKGDA